MFVAWRDNENLSPIGATFGFVRYVAPPELEGGGGHLVLQTCRAYGTASRHTRYGAIYFVNHLFTPLIRRGACAELDYLRSVVYSLRSSVATLVSFV